MEAKLKALKVVELRELLTDAKVPIPARANKPDLITKIIDTEAASSLYQRKYGDETGKASGATTPRPMAATASVAVEMGDVEIPKPVVEIEKESNILAPPEPFDWSASAEPPASSDSNSAAPAAVPLTSSTTTQQPTQIATPQDRLDEDEEARQRRARAERFGSPIVETPATSQSKKTYKPADAKSVTPTINGPRAKKATGKASTFIEEDPEKLKARALRFGLVDKANPAEARPLRFGLVDKANPAKAVAGAKATNEKKRTAPAEQADAEEAERRRKRAERFGLPVKT